MNGPYWQGGTSLKRAHSRPRLSPPQLHDAPPAAAVAHFALYPFHVKHPNAYPSSREYRKGAALR